MWRLSASVVNNCVVVVKNSRGRSSHVRKRLPWLKHDCHTVNSHCFCHFLLSPRAGCLRTLANLSALQCGCFIKAPHYTKVSCLRNFAFWGQANAQHPGNSNCVFLVRLIDRFIVSDSHQWKKSDCSCKVVMDQWAWTLKWYCRKQFKRARVFCCYVICFTALVTFTFIRLSFLFSNGPRIH